MNGAHDMGGRMGRGPVHPEKNEPVFHEPWEGRCFGIVCAFGQTAPWTLDEDRHACENRHPAQYLQSSYYEKWFEALRALLVKHGVVTTEEIATGRVLVNATPTAVLQAADVPAALAAHISYIRDVNSPARFKIGDRVRTKNIQTFGHTRLPGYLRGHSGVVVARHGAYVFPDANAHGQGEQANHLYTVRFNALDVWGRDSKDSVSADLWEAYLEPA